MTENSLHLMIVARNTMAKVTMEKIESTRMAKRALQMVSALIEKHGSRLTGSSACKAVADELESLFQKQCDMSVKESFFVHPDAFLGWINILVLLYPIALLFAWLSLPIISLALMGASLVIMLTQFLLYRELIDPLFAKAEGFNVYGVLEPKGEVEQTVIYSGHHDSAKVFTFYVDKPELYLLRIGIGIGAILALTLLTIIQSFYQGFTGSLFRVHLPPVGFIVVLGFLTLILPWVLKLSKFASKEGTPGAGDNLIASTMGVELARYFKERKEGDKALAKTRLIFASFDSEEAGLRGSRAFYQRHKDNKELLKGRVWNFNVDCPYNAKDLFFLTSDINGSVKLSQEMATECVTIAKSMGFEAFSQPIAILTGGTDAAEAAKVGIEATTLMAMPWDNKNRSNVYHTLDDLPEAIDPVAIERALSIAIRFIEQVDKSSATA